MISAAKTNENAPDLDIDLCGQSGNGICLLIALEVCWWAVHWWADSKMHTCGDVAVQHLTTDRYWDFDQDHCVLVRVNSKLGYSTTAMGASYKWG